MSGPKSIMEAIRRKGRERKVAEREAEKLTEELDVSTIPDPKEPEPEGSDTPIVEGKDLDGKGEAAHGNGNGNDKEKDKDDKDDKKMVKCPTCNGEGKVPEKDAEKEKDKKEDRASKEEEINRKADEIILKVVNSTTEGKVKEVLRAIDMFYDEDLSLDELEEFISSRIKDGGSIGDITSLLR